GLVEHGAERLALGVGREHRAAHQPPKVLVVADERVEAVEVRLDGVHRIALERELEQGVRIPARHSGNDRLFACHVVARSLLIFAADQAPRRVAPRLWNSMKNSDFGGSPRSALSPAKIAWLLTHRGGRCNIRSPVGRSIRPKSYSPSWCRRITSRKSSPYR